jgi:hypothetical protein
MGILSNRACRCGRSLDHMIKSFDDVRNHATLPGQFRVLYPEWRWRELLELGED